MCNLAGRHPSARELCLIMSTDEQTQKWEDFEKVLLEVQKRGRKTMSTHSSEPPQGAPFTKKQLTMLANVIATSIKTARQPLLARISELERRLKGSPPPEAAFVDLSKRLTDLEQQTEYCLRYRGEYAKGMGVSPRSVVSYQGKLYVATRHAFDTDWPGAINDNVFRLLVGGGKDDLLEKRVQSLEARGSGLEYQGVFIDGKDYSKGDCVSEGGSMWVCTGRTSARPGGPSAESRNWSLAVKRGRDGKDFR